ncbi:MAG TPA: VCBS repeat-containing protein [Methylomirabilota bacterium]|nr:VCBS repeat-containing protein [Methylomirabilota bacterium]
MAEALHRRRQSHRLLIGSSLLLWLIVIGLGVFGYRFARPALEGALATMKPPAELATPRVVTGADWLTKTSALSEPGLGSVTAIALLAGLAGTGDSLVAAGTEGAVVLDLGWAPRRRVTFEGCAAHVDVIPPAPTRPLRFLNRGSWSCSTSLLDQDGRALWRYGGRGSGGGVDDAVAGDLDGDGTLGVVVGFNGSGGVHRLDVSGKKLWSQPDGNVWRVELVDLDGSGRPVIVHSNASGQLTIRDRAGRVVRRERPAVYLSHFALTRWPGRDGPVRILEISDRGLWLFDFNGNIAWQLGAPLASRTLRPRGAPVRLGAGQPEYFAAVAAWGAWRRSVLWVYTRSGSLRYQEVLPEACAAIAAMPDAESGADALLLGCEGKIWRYAPAK